MGRTQAKMDEKTIEYLIGKNESELFILYAYDGQWEQALHLLEKSSFLRGNLTSSEALERAACQAYEGGIENALKRCQRPGTLFNEKAQKLEHLSFALNCVSQAKENAVALKPESEKNLEDFFRGFCASGGINYATGCFDVLGILYEAISYPCFKKNVKIVLDLVESARGLGINVPLFNDKKVVEEYNLIPVEFNLYEDKGTKIDLRLREGWAEIWFRRPKPGYLTEDIATPYYFSEGKYGKAAAGQDQGKRYDREKLPPQKASMPEEIKKIAIISMRAKGLERDFLKSAGAGELIKLEDLLDQIT